MRKTKIVCTLGPAVDNDEKMRELMLAGMDCARLNFSHGTHEEQKVRMDRVKRIRAELGLNVPILLDTKGPEIRLRDFEEGFVTVEEGQIFTLFSDFNRMGTAEGIGLTFANLAKNVQEGTRILIDDGKVAMVVDHIDGKDVVCRVVNGGRLSNHKSINVPNVMINMPYISETDRADIVFGIEQEVDYIAASFVRSADDIKILRDVLAANGGDDIKIISKIENRGGVKHLDEIIDVSDGVMVARGDLGVEIPFTELPAIQKEMISKCLKKGKLVITATQMLESMITNPRPTRAEVSDIANAIYDGTTAIMLSGESAAGAYPIESVHTMAEIAEETEKGINYEVRFKHHKLDVKPGFMNTISYAACSASFQIGAKAIISVSRSGRTIEALSHYHTDCPIIAEVIDDRALRQLNLAWNVRPVKAEEKFSMDELFASAIDSAKATGLVGDGDVAIITSSSGMAQQETNVMKLQKL